MKQRMLVIRDPRRFEMVMNPLRLEIVEQLKDGPDSIAGLARRLDRRANALTYHVRQLEQAGVVVRAGVRRVGRRDEALFALVAPRIAFAADVSSRSMLRAVARSAGVVMRTAAREIVRAVETGRSRPDQLAGRPLVRRQRARLTEHDVAAVHRKLVSLERFVERCHRTNQGRLYAMTMVVAPLESERKD